MTVTIREATSDDIPALDTLYGQIERLHRAHEPDFFVAPTPDARLVLVRRWVRAHDRHVFVADDDMAGLIGMLFCIVRRIGGVAVVRERDVVVIDTLVVDAHHGRKGIGTQLMERVHRWGKAQGIREFQLGVWAFNTGAMALYEGLGYRTYQQRMVLSADEDSH